MGHPWGKDHANGNLLAQGNEMTMDQDATPDVDNPQMGPTHINGLEVHPGTFGVAHGTRLPRRVIAHAPHEPPMGAVAEVTCSTYSTLAITVDGKAYAWGDCDGGSPGHNVGECHIRRWLASLAGLRVAHGGVCYTNGAAATEDGSVYVWGRRDVAGRPGRRQRWAAARRVWRWCAARVQGE